MTLNENLSHLNQVDLEDLIRERFIDESQALLLFQQIMTTGKHKDSAYTLKNDLYIGGFVPLVYSLHFCFLCLCVSLSLVHKHFTMKVSMVLFIIIKLGEIMFFYFFALYMQDNDCHNFSTIVHTIFDISVYHLLLDILDELEFRADDFRFDIKKVGNREKLRGKLVFNVTLLSISYISCL